MMDVIATMESVADALETAGVPFAIGGSIAMSFHGYARGTKDVDVNVFVPMAEARNALMILQGAGVALDLDEAVRSAAGRGDAVGWLGDVRVDLFFDSIPLHTAARERRRVVEFGGRRLPVLAAEDLIVLKLMFNRSKDLVDVERMVAAGSGRIDIGYLRAQLAAHVGEDDPAMEFLNHVWSRWGST